MAEITSIYGNTLADTAVRASIADAYSTSSTYAVGDMVLKDGQLYECNTAISTAEAWTAAHWTAVTVEGELSSLKEDISKLDGSVDSINNRFIVAQNYFTDYTNRIENRYMDYSGGYSQAVTGYVLLSFPRTVLTGSDYTLTGLDATRQAHICFKSAETYNRGDYVGGVLSSGTEFSFTIPSGTNYIFISVPMDIEDSIILSETSAKNQLKNEWLDAEYIREISGALIVTAGVGKDFAKLTDAIDYARQHPNTTIYASGVFDFRQELGETYFDDFSYSVSNSGTIIGNNTTLIFEKGSGIVFEYDGNNTQVESGYSPLSALYPNSGYEPSFTIIGGFIRCKNCRFCVHDDVGEVYNKPYLNKYIGVEFSIDNSENSTSWHNRGDAIGGGLGKYGEVYISDCVVNSITSNQAYDGIAYHTNNAYHDSDCKVVIKDSYIGGLGTIACRSYGSHNGTMSYMYASNNNVGQAIKYEKSTPESADSITLISWNNYIRS